MGVAKNVKNIFGDDGNRHEWHYFLSGAVRGDKYIFRKWMADERYAINKNSISMEGFR